MGAGAARPVTPVRPRWRSYLLLSRLSNLPTVWSNVLAGTVAAQAGFSWTGVTRVAVGVSLLYVGGMFLNDACDREADALGRPDRPLPSGEVTLRAVVAAGSLLLTAGVATIAVQTGFAGPLVWSLALAAAIVYYDIRHKRDRFAPLVMGICRGLVYCVSAAAVAGTIPSRVGVAALALTAYVGFLTWVSRRLGPRAGIAVPVLIAAISAVDAVVVAVSGGGGTLVVIAGSGFLLTLMLQRVVPGT